MLLKIPESGKKITNFQNIMQTFQGCKAVMYHYVRNYDINLPNLKFLHIDDFKKQLDFFAKSYGFITKSDRENFILHKNGDVPNGVLLTFDDGLIDHFDYVLPILRERNLWGSFFVSSNSLVRGQVLNVHKIHYLLGKFDAFDIYKNLLSIIDKNFLDELGEITAYIHQKNDEYTTSIKKLNYIKNFELQSLLIDFLLKSFSIISDDIWSSIYMTGEQLKELSNYGNIVGGHSASHFLMGNICTEQLNFEISDANLKLSNYIEKPIDCFCYPFGGNNSYNPQIINYLKKDNIKYSYVVNSKDIVSKDLKNIYQLPRYDCNEFPFGQCR